MIERRTLLAGIASLPLVGRAFAQESFRKYDLNKLLSEIEGSTEERRQLAIDVIDRIKSYAQNPDNFANAKDVNFLNKDVSNMQAEIRFGDIYIGVSFTQKDGKYSEFNIYLADTPTSVSSFDLYSDNENFGIVREVFGSLGGLNFGGERPNLRTKDKIMSAEQRVLINRLYKGVLEVILNLG